MHTTLCRVESTCIQFLLHTHHFKYTTLNQDIMRTIRNYLVQAIGYYNAENYYQGETKEWYESSFISIYSNDSMLFKI